jgi:hypothetical protein
MAKGLRLGITLTEEDAKVFWENEKTFVPTQEQKDNLKEAQRIYSKNPLVLEGEEAKEFLENEHGTIFTLEQLEFFRQAKRIYKENSDKF